MAKFFAIPALNVAGWSNVKEVIAVGYQWCSKRVTWRAAVSAQLTVA